MTAAFGIITALKNIYYDESTLQSVSFISMFSMDD